MSKPNSGLFKGTSGLQSHHKNILPTEPSQIKHIFSVRKGHLANNAKNRKTIERLVNGKSNYIGTDSLGRKWYTKIAKNGAQYWGWVKNGKLGDGGYNRTPKKWNDKTGFCKTYPNNWNPAKKHGGKTK